MEQNTEKVYKYKVCTRCMTYNHAPYIVDAMNGFAMQETDFPVVFTIIDDASTDGEPEVLRKWVDENLDSGKENLIWETLPYGVQTVASLKGKPNLLFVVLLLNENHYQKKMGKKKLDYISEWNKQAKYIAACEGDDYWTNSLKLQKQVDFLDNNPDFIECSHRFWIKDERKGTKNQSLVEYEDHTTLNFTNEYGVLGYEYNSDNYWEHWYSQPLTVVMRNAPCMETIPRERYKYFRDVIHHYYAMRNGKGMLLEELMGVYRKTDGGIFAGNRLIDNAKITNNNLRTIYEVESDDRVLPVLHKNVVTLWKYAISHLRIKESYILLKEHYRLIPKREIWPFTKMLIIEPFMIIKRKSTGNKK